MRNNKKPTNNEIMNAIENQPKISKKTVLSCLLAISNEFHFIPKNAVEIVAKYTGKTTNDVWGVASFYTNFRFTPPCKNILEVCWGPTCHLKGAPDLISGFLDKLNLEEEGDSKDKDVSVRYNTCLGACQQAPVISINHSLRGNVKVSEISNIIDFVAD